jgi:hypothetical protein
MEGFYSIPNEYIKSSIQEKLNEESTKRLQTVITIEVNDMTKISGRVNKFIKDPLGSIKEFIQTYWKDIVSFVVTTAFGVWCTAVTGGVGIVNCLAAGALIGSFLKQVLKVIEKSIQKGYLTFETLNFGEFTIDAVKELLFGIVFVGVGKLVMPFASKGISYISGKVNGMNFWRQAVDKGDELCLASKTCAGIAENFGRKLTKDLSTETVEWMAKGAKDQIVYVLRDKNNKVIYAGITNDVNRRRMEHVKDKSFDIMEQVTSNASNLTKNQARAIEQKLIDHYNLVSDPEALNKINSIALSRNI